MIISVHIPKTAGSSFFRALNENYTHRVMHDKTWNRDENEPYIRTFLNKYDYCENPFRATLPTSLFFQTWKWFYERRERPSIRSTSFYRACSNYYFYWKRHQLSEEIADIKSKYDVIHGHFPAGKYKYLIPDAKLAIFFRDPKTHLISHYHYLSRNKLHPTHLNKRQADNSPSFQIHENSIDLVKFSENYRVKQLYRRYLSFLDIQAFDFVGLVEEYDTSIKLFNSIFNANLTVYNMNKTPESVGRQIITSLDEEAIISNNLKEKMEIYDQAKRRFEFLCRQYL